MGFSGAACDAIGIPKCPMPKMPILGSWQPLTPDDFAKNL